MAQNSRKNEELARVINTVLLRKGGELKILNVNTLLHELRTKCDVQIPNGQALLRFLENFPNNFAISTVRYGKTKPVTQIRMVSDIELCGEYSKKLGICIGECGQLHICKFFLLSGHCEFGPQCKFGHDYTSEHNFNILISHLLDPKLMKIEDLRELLCNHECRNATTMPNTCKFYNTSHTCTNKTCKNLHICRHFLEGSCKFGPRCNRNHSVLESSVLDILKDYGFDVNQDSEVILHDLQDHFQNKKSADVRSSQSLMLSSRGRSVMHLAGLSVMSAPTPQPQKQRGRSAVRNQKTIGDFSGYRSRSIEQHQLQDSEGPLSAAYRRSMALRPTMPTRPIMPIMPIPLKLELTPKSSLTSKPALPAKLTKTRSTSVTQESVLVICIHHLRGKCLFGSNCRYHHKSTIYQWQWKAGSDFEWNDFGEEENIQLEKNFCQVENTECYLKMGSDVVMVNFKTMTATGGPSSSVRRLTTVSTNTVPPNILEWTTEWHWYWKDIEGTWKEYGAPNVKGQRSEVDSDKIEERFQENPDGSITFGNGRHEYVLLFTDMHQMNVKTKTLRSVRRRPTFFHPEDIHKRRIHKIKSGDFESLIPKEWQVLGKSIYAHYRIIMVDKSSDEFKAIDKMFHKTMPQTKIITSLERIENGELWNSFCIKRNQMKRKLGKEADERQLFHGTQADNIEAICRQGFDFRFCGKAVGTRYGKGSYFSSQAKYSDAYTVNCGKMFVALTLVGEFSEGDTSFVRPPPKDASQPFGDLFDSCVNDVAKPKIFVIFDLYQVYPQYIINYQ